MEIHASIPENRVLQLTRRLKNGFRKNRSHFFVQCFLGTWNYNSKHSVLHDKIKFLWSFKKPKSKTEVD